MPSQLIKMAKDMMPDLIKIRRQIHSNPELGFEEYETAALVAQKLKKSGLSVTEKVGRTGVVGLLKGSTGGKTVALRSDMDALPLTELTGTEYASRKKGLMHACGHDAHTTMLLGAAALLAQNKHRIKGNVKFIFQSCEEEPPGGAIEMIRDGVLVNPAVEAVFGLHVDPNYPVGFVGYKEGIMMAAVDNFTLEVIGKGGHGAAPHMGIDAIVAAAEVIQSLQTIASRRVNPLESLVISIGTIAGGQKDNIIADMVTMTGTVRTLKPYLREEIQGLIENTVRSVTAAYGADYRLQYNNSYPPLVNNNEMVHLIKKAAEKIVSPNDVIPLTYPSMGGEDFAYYAERVPAAFVNLGVGFSGRENFSLHHPCFDLDETALPLGAAILAYSAIEFLNQKV